tara:strand:- start:5617 stop:7182 length:1566 start_codon:yes stop_codon:yes gene_type:complete
LKRPFSILLIFFCSIGYGQLIFQKPDSNLIARSNSQVQVASLLIDADIDFFEKALKQSINSKEVYELEIKIQDAKLLNIYFDNFKLSKASSLEVYNETGDLKVKVNSDNNREGELYAIPPIKGSSIKLIFKGNRSNSKIFIGEIGYFWKSFDDAYSSEPCEVDVNCSEGDEWKNQKNGVVRLLLKKNSSGVYCSGTILNNTSRDCRPYILSAEHCVNDATSGNLKQSFAYFNYENCNCGIDNAASGNFILGMTKRASTKFNNSSDILLLELDEEIPVEFNPYFNGWDISNIASPSGVSIHHPKGDVKKISTYTSTLKTADEFGLTEDAFWKVTWAETTNGHGVTESGSSGSPIFNHEKLVVGVLSYGDSYCIKPEDPDYYGKVSYSWNNQPDSSKRLDVWLDPLQTFEESITGSYFPCENNNQVGSYFLCEDTSSYIYQDSIVIKLNPTSDGINVYIEQTILNSVELFLVDVSGKIIFSRNEPSSNLTIIEVPTNNIRNGLYFAVLHAGNKKQIFKVVVVN